MGIIYKRVHEPKNNARFLITVSYEHGDADKTTHETLKRAGMTEGEFLAFVCKFGELKNHINHYRSSGGSNFDFEWWEEYVGIEIERDCIYGCGDYPPRVDITRVQWVDNDSNIHDVTGY